MDNLVYAILRNDAIQMGRQAATSSDPELFLSRAAAYFTAEVYDRVEYFRGLMIVGKLEDDARQAYEAALAAA